MTNQALLNLSHIAVAIGVIITALGGYGAFHFQKKIDDQKEKSTEVRPIVDLCKRGISVTKVNDSTATFDIPYCSGKNVNAHNVKLRTAILLKTKLKFMRSKIKYITVLGITLLIACSSTQKKNTQEDDSVVETVVNEDAFTSSKNNMLEKDNPFEIEILRYSTVELKQRIGKADPENIRDLFLLLHKNNIYLCHHSA